MSANPNRVDNATAPAAVDPSSALCEGNRVLESIARQEALRSLLAFSELHERIRSRRAAAQNASDDLFQTERFVLDEVLQLICDRALAITGADGVVIALAEGSAIVSRAASGSVLVDRGTRISLNSELLAECLESGHIVRCDDVETDVRAELDLAREMGATSSVIVPLRGTRARLGILQAFSRIRLGFSDNDVRCLDLFAELVLSALKPEDQDRRINWLTDLATEVLYAKPTATPSPEPPLTVAEIPLADEPELAAWPGVAEAHVPVPEGFLTPSETSEEVAEPTPPAQDERRDEETGRARWVPDLALFSSSRPGLSVVLGLVAVAALFSAGVWWGMQVHNPAAKAAGKSLTAPSFAPGVPSSAELADNLMDPAKFAPEAAASADNKPLPKITGIRHWSSDMGSTVVIDMEDQVPYEVHRLMSPERIYFDLHDTALVPSLDGQSIEVGDVALSRVRIAQPITGVTRLVLDTRDGSNFSVSLESNPYRLVIELRGNDRAVAGNRVPAPVSPRPAPAAAAVAPTPLKSAETRLPAHSGKFRIVLDAGHGGWDLGTVGRKGLLEKNLVLDVTQRLGKLLQARLGAEVLFTRTGDDYLPLDQRADFANQAQADLFVSVHANYSNNADARGVETYYTNFFAAPGSGEIERRENGTAKPVTVSLSSAALQEKVEESRRLAASVQRALYATLASKNPDIRDRGAKASGFVVLTGTTMPAILTEISFVSSPADEHNLQSEAYRQQIAEALYKGISRYEESAQHVKVAQLQQTSAHR